jgi:hypothetical protein
MLLKLFGVSQLMAMFDNAKNVKFGEAWVGSAVEYGPMHEFGTPTMQARPHWRPAIAEIAAQIGSDQGLQTEIMEGLVTDDEEMAPIQVALMIERRVKEIIASKGIFDTGNYRGSVATGNTEGQAFAKSAALAIDPDSVAK